MKKSYYGNRKRNAKAQEIQARFDEYKAKNEVKVTAINEARAENKRLREALEFYASTKTYETDVVSQWEPVTLINQDLGEKARQALEGEPND